MRVLLLTLLLGFGLFGGRLFGLFSSAEFPSGFARRIHTQRVENPGNSTGRPALLASNGSGRATGGLRSGESTADTIPLRLIVQWKTGDQFSKERGGSPTRDFRGEFTYLDPATRRIQLLKFGSEERWRAAYRKLQNDERVAAVQFDYTVRFRSTPDDPRYPEQENLTRAGFPEVWAAATGGTTAAGDPIAIAVIDSGLDLEHEDLVSSLWINPGEIPDDGIDNDNNGYVDDLHGWNFREGNETFEGTQHGTQVAGILGARGNNGRGIAGTGWNNRIMTFAIDEVSDIIAAYAYVVDQRKRWQDSDGRDGTLVVATNASFGLEGRFCGEFPIWADMYEQLGRLGVLTAASTANRSWNVDDFGDMPTTCSTEFVLGVTNLGPDDRLWRSAAWGRESVDLAAPGQGSYTTWVDDRYGSFASTSAAAPYVTGAIALLHSLPCDRLQFLLKNDPVSAARLIRRALLQSARPNDALFNLTATEGQLDVAAAWNRLRSDCESAQGDALDILKIYPNPGRELFHLEFSDPSLGPYVLDLFDATGRLMRRYELPMGSSFPIVNPLPVDELARGVYRLRLSNGREVAWGTVVLQ